MEVYVAAYLVLLCLGACRYLLRTILIRLSGRKPLPPGPLVLPIIGHLHLLAIADAKQPHMLFDKLASKYGPLMWLKMGSLPLVVASTSEMARQLLLTHGRNVAFRPPLTAAVHMLFDCSNIGFSKGPHWKFVRKLSVFHLFKSKRMDRFRAVRQEETNRLLLSVLHDCSASHDAVVQLRPKLQCAANDVICRITLGQRFSDLSSIDLIPLVEELLAVMGTPDLADIFPALGWLDLQGSIKRMKAWTKRAEKAIGQVMNERREARMQGASDDNEDLLDVLLSMADDPNSEYALTDESVIAVLMDMFSAGTDTTSATVEWALAEMVMNPSIMTRVQEEIDGRVGKDRLVEEADLPDLPLVRAVVKESLRLHPVTPLLLPRQCVEACQINGYCIPANTTVLVNAWRIQRDPSVWDEPLRFWPDRFLDSVKTDLYSQQLEYLPFGAGLRVCPGRQLAYLSTELMLARLLHCFNWETPPSSDGSSPAPVDMSECYHLTMSMSCPLSAKATPRLPLHVLATR